MRAGYDKIGSSANAHRQLSADTERHVRYDFSCNTDRADNNSQECGTVKTKQSFAKYNPQAVSPHLTGYCLHPLRDDVPLLDPCSGFLSSGADADMRPATGRRIPCLAGLSDAKHPVHTDPHHLLQGARCHTVTRQAQEKSSKVDKWNSVAKPEASLRAELGGWTSNVKIIPQVTRGHGTSLAPKFVLQQSQDSCSRDSLVHRFVYTSSTQRSYEDVPWDIKLPPKLKPPESTLERLPDPISQHFTLKRYEPEPEIWQVAGGIWDRFQTRLFHGQKKPLTFVSPYPHMDHIPGYCGFTGSVNTEDIDDPNVVFRPFTKVRTPQPRYTTTAHTPNIPGYTGRVHWIAIHPANSNLLSPSSSAGTKMSGLLTESRTGSPFNHQAPLSKMVTTVSPFNPYNKTDKEIIA
ncbi:protein SPMIP7 isoform X2 [Hyperolius riggenbachi]|uniref:protein SPMIP7 isoform X2 n=1 Tax=Hyperolius riggenbachi TaxID=752182 RepID=UPI0035A38B1E